MGIEESGNGRPGYDFLKSDLKLAIEKVRIGPGGFLVVRPKHPNMQFAPEYADWLSQSLAEILPPGTPAMILRDDSTRIESLEPEPPDDEIYAQAYENGWRDAFKALERACS